MEKRRKKVPGTMWPKKLPISNRSNSSGFKFLCSQNKVKYLHLSKTDC
jgi:hypothetical protein